MPLVLSGDGAVGPLSATEVSYLDGVTSAVQTQLNGKLATPGEWSAWTPTYANLSGGTLNVARYTQIGKLVTCYWKYTLAGAGVAGSVTVSLPVTASSNMVPAMPVGHAWFDDTNNDAYSGVVVYNNTTSVVIDRFENVTNTIRPRGISSTTPFTWGSGDALFAYWSYEAA